MNICLNIDIVTIFPEVFYGPFSESIMKRAMEKGLVGINTVDLRNFTDDRHRTVDDRPYGGGPGMLMKPEPFYKAVDSLRRKDTKVLLMSPDGEMFTQAIARELAAETHIVILCGHYEGVDERVGSGLADRILTIGDYVMTNGNIAAMAVVDSVVRLIPGVLGCESSKTEESHSAFLLEYPQFTRPEVFKGMKVPELLLSGDHGKIREWRLSQSLEITRKRRPDLFEKYGKWMKNSKDVLK